MSNMKINCYENNVSSSEIKSNEYNITIIINSSNEIIKKDKIYNNFMLNDIDNDENR